MKEIIENVILLIKERNGKPFSTVEITELYKERYGAVENTEIIEALNLLYSY